MLFNSVLVWESQETGSDTPSAFKSKFAHRGGIEFKPKLSALFWEYETKVWIS